MLFIVFRWSTYGVPSKRGLEHAPCDGAYLKEIAKNTDGSSHLEWFIDVPDLEALMDLLRKLQSEENVGAVYIKSSKRDAKWNFIDIDDQW